ncbi:hypothetical protein L9F63_000479, partial [Diploptera punctata]
CTKKRNEKKEDFQEMEVTPRKIQRVDEIIRENRRHHLFGPLKKALHRIHFEDEEAWNTYLRRSCP